MHYTFMNDFLLFDYTFMNDFYNFNPVLIPCLSYAYLSVFFRYSFGEVPMKFL